MSGVITIYMRLCNEGTPVWRPVRAQPLGADRFCVLGPKPEDEEWEFAPNTVVRGKRHTFDDGQEGIIAVPDDAL